MISIRIDKHGLKAKGDTIEDYHNFVKILGGGFIPGMKVTLKGVDVLIEKNKVTIDVPGFSSLVGGGKL